jgi:hypothetical protein
MYEACIWNSAFPRRAPPILQPGRAALALRRMTRRAFTGGLRAYRPSKYLKDKPRLRGEGGFAFYTSFPPRRKLLCTPTNDYSEWTMTRKNGSRPGLLADASFRLLDVS